MWGLVNGRGSSGDARAAKRLGCPSPGAAITIPLYFVRVSAPTHETEESSGALSWGGAGVALLAASVLAYAALGKIVDGNIQIEDASGRSIVYEGGSVGTYAALLLLMVAAGCAALGLMTGRLGRLVGSAFTVGMGVCLLWWLMGSAMWRRGDLSLVELALVPIGVLIAAGAVVDPPNYGTMRALNLIRDVGAAGAIGVSVLLPQVGAVACRADKCGVFGSMWTGYFMHENAASGVFIVLLPLAVTYRRLWPRLVACALVGVLVAGSGSRTALLAFAVAVGFLAVHTLLTRVGLPLVVTAAPVAAYAVSAAFLFGLIPISLTGRDWIYDAIVTSLSGYAAVFGPGSPALIRQTGGWVIGEHGQAPHVLLQLGWVGFVLFGATLVALIRYTGSRRMSHILGVAMVMVPAARFVTESALLFETRTMEFVALCLAMSMLASPGESRGRSDPRELDALRAAAADLSILSYHQTGHGGVHLPQQVHHEAHVTDQAAFVRDDHDDREGRPQDRGELGRGGSRRRAHHDEAGPDR